MSKKTTYIHAENNNKILSSNEVRLYVPPEPEKMKIIIWGKELCNVAEWNDFLKCVEEKTRENDKLKQQLVEKDKEIKKLNWQLKDKDFIIKNLNHSLSVAPNANAGQRARIDELTKIVKEKDKEINSLIADYEKRISQEQELMSNMEHRLVEKQNTIDEINKNFVQAVHDWKVLCAEKDKEIESLTNRTNRYENMFRSRISRTGDMQKDIELYMKQLAIQELEKVHAMLVSKAREVVGTGVVAVRLYTINEVIDQQIKELKGENK